MLHISKNPERMNEMEADVFSYFMAIGSGLSLGIAVVVLPGLWVAKKIMTKKGAKQRGIV